MNRTACVGLRSVANSSAKNAMTKWQNDKLFGESAKNNKRFYWDSKTNCHVSFCQDYAIMHQNIMRSVKLRGVARKSAKYFVIVAHRLSPCRNALLSLLASQYRYTTTRSGHNRHCRPLQGFRHCRPLLATRRVAAVFRSRSGCRTLRLFAAS